MEKYGKPRRIKTDVEYVGGNVWKKCGSFNSC